MNSHHTDFTYEEFLAFVLLFAAEMNIDLSPEEKAFIQAKTGVKDIEKIKSRLDNMADAEGIELIDNYKKIYLNTPESVVKAKRDLEALLKTPGEHSQFEKAAIHLIEKLI